MIATALLASAAALSSGCFVQSYSYSAPIVRYSAPVYSAPVQHYVAPVTKTIVFYGVGTNLQVQSLVKQQLRSDSDYQQFLQWKANRSRPAPAQPQQPPADQPPPPPQSTEPLPPPPATGGNGVPQVTIAQTCARCHGTATPEGNFYLDGAATVDDATFARASDMIMLGKMPPGTDREGQPIAGHQPLTPVQKFQLIEDLVRLHIPPEEN